MGFQVSQSQLDEIFRLWEQDYTVYAPKRFPSGGAFSDTDCIRYGPVKSIKEVVFDRQSQYSFKEVLTPISQTLFYFTEEQVREAEPQKKGAIIFLRSCDLHAVKRLDDLYLNNGAEDYYYRRMRERLKVVLMGCKSSFENCFCVSMGTNFSSEYDMSIDPQNENWLIDCREAAWCNALAKLGALEQEVRPAHVTENSVRLHIPESLDHRVDSSKMWAEYDSRCINCGRCNFVCPTCTCFTMQDLFFTENGRVGERRRVWASCMVDGFTDVAGGGSYRQKNGQRMRFKVMHKILDHAVRFGYTMCVGCGRCDSICPEYISFSNCVSKLGAAMEEVTQYDGK